MNMIRKFAAVATTGAALLGVMTAVAPSASAAVSRKACGDDLNSGARACLTTWWEGNVIVGAYAQIEDTQLNRTATNAHYFSNGNTADDDTRENGFYYRQLGWYVSPGSWVCVDISYAYGTARTCRDAP